jgi:hypothetical protein
MIDGNEKYMTVGIIGMSRYSLLSKEILEKFIRELHGVANHVNTRPNSLGRIDKHKINFIQRQLHPSMIGIIDLLYSSKDVGQTGMISPWADIKMLSDVDINKYPNVKYDLFNFIRDEFDDAALTFDCDNIVDYNRILDRLVEAAYVNFEWKIPETEGLDEEYDDI